MTPPPELLDAIHTDTGDAARLAIADWFDEQGEADLARFVRVQCRLARDRELRLPAGEKKSLRDEERQLLPHALERWGAGLEPFRHEGKAWWTLSLARGFPNALTTLTGGGQTFTPDMLSAVAALGTLRSLHVPSRSTVRLADLSLLEPLRVLCTLRLNLADRELTDEHTKALAELPRLVSVDLRGPGGRRLDFRQAVKVREARLEALAATPDAGLDRRVVETLGSAMQTANCGLRTLTAGAFGEHLPLVGRVPRVGSLLVSGPELGDLPDLPELRVLGLYRMRAIDTDRLRHLTGLREVAGYYEGTPDAGEFADFCEWLASLPRLAALQWYGTAPDPFPARAADALARCRGLRSLALHGTYAGATCGPLSLPNLVDFDGVPEPWAASARERCPSLRVARHTQAHIPARRVPELRFAGQLYWTDGRYLSGQESWWPLHYAENHSVEADLDGRVSVRVPSWYRRLPTPEPSESTPGVTPLGLWCEWGDGDPGDRLGQRGPGWLLLERLDFRVKAAEYRTLMCGPPTELFDPKAWGARSRVAPEGAPPRYQVVGRTQWQGQRRCLWVGKKRAYRLRAEWGHARLLDGAALSDAVAGTLRGDIDAG